MLMLTHAERSELPIGYARKCISWTRDGTAFTVHDKGELVQGLLPNFFPKAKFASFTRKLYRWGFRQLSLFAPDGRPGSLTGMERRKSKELRFGHEFFQRDNKPLMSHMRSVTAAGTRRALAAVALRQQRQLLAANQQLKGGSLEPNDGEAQDGRIGSATQQDPLHDNLPISPAVYAGMRHGCNGNPSLSQRENIPLQQTQHVPSALRPAAHLVPRSTVPSLQQQTQPTMDATGSTGVVTRPEHFNAAAAAFLVSTAAQVAAVAQQYQQQMMVVNGGHAPAPVLPFGPPAQIASLPNKVAAPGSLHLPLVNTAPTPSQALGIHGVGETSGTNKNGELQSATQQSPSHASPGGEGREEVRGDVSQSGNEHQSPNPPKQSPSKKSIPRQENTQENGQPAGQYMQSAVDLLLRYAS